MSKLRKLRSIAILLSVCVATVTGTAFADDHPYPNSTKATKEPPANGQGEAKYQVYDQHDKVFPASMAVYEDCTQRAFWYQQGSFKATAPLPDITHENFATSNGDGIFTDEFEWNRQEAINSAKAAGFNHGTVQFTWVFAQVYTVKWKEKEYPVGGYVRMFKDTLDLDSPTPTPTPHP